MFGTTRRWVLGSLVVATVLVGGAPEARADDDPLKNDGGALVVRDLEIILTRGLRARLPQEEAYLKSVAALTEAGQIPRKLVISTFLWARKKPKNMVEYFDQALFVRATALNISVPRLELQTQF